MVVVAPYAYLLLFAMPQLVSEASLTRGLSIFQVVRKLPKLQVNNFVFFQVGKASARHQLRCNTLEQKYTSHLTLCFELGVTLASPFRPSFDL